MDTGHETIVGRALFLGITVATDSPNHLVAVWGIIPSAEPGRGNGEAETDVAFRQPGFGALSPPPFARFGQGAVYRRRQPGQVALQHVVDRALLEGIGREFFSHLARDEDERDIRPAVSGDLQRGQAIDLG
jgi:hypothetical protein